MIGKATQAWDWFTGGLAEAALWVAARLTGSAAYRLMVGESGAVLQAPDGAAIGRIVEADGVARLEPANLAQRIGGARIDILVPASWLFRRSLDPVAVQSIPFLDAFVRHHIERITPWRAADVHYQILQKAMAGDPSRVAVEVCVVPRRLLKDCVAALDGARPNRLRILSQAAAQEGEPAILVGVGAGGSGPALRLRRGFAQCLIATSLAFSGALGWIWWDIGLVQEDIAEQDRVADERKAVLTRARLKDQGGHDLQEKLRLLRQSRARAVDLIETLARALPDSAHLTTLDLQKVQMTIGGISTDTSVLVPALEKSGRFADVAFGTPITKVESGQGDRFQLVMRVRDPDPASQ